MPLELTPLEPEHLTEAVARAVDPSAPAQARMMAAKGLVPMGPVEMVTALYQLALDGDPKIADAAQAQVSKLPEAILAAGLEAQRDPRVLDYYSTLVEDAGRPVDCILLNPAVHDDTVLQLASKLGEKATEIIAGNQQRLLRCPSIIEALYFNPKARMSTVQRLLEMAVRNGLDLTRIPQFKELEASILGTVPEEPPDEVEDIFDDEGLDEAFNTVMEEDYFGEEEEFGEDWEQRGIFDEDELMVDDGEDQEDLNIMAMPVNAKVRLATIGSTQHRATLIKDANRLVSLAAISSPAVSDAEAARHARNRSLHEDVVRFIASKKEWQKNYTVKVALVFNPKCPLPYSMRMINHLRNHDLKSLANSKNVPSVLAQAAKRLMRTRMGK
jgi:hypothetical protein